LVPGELTRELTSHHALKIMHPTSHIVLPTVEQVRPRPVSSLWELRGLGLYGHRLGSCAGKRRDRWD
jgi:hypothetical protein